MLVVTPQEPLLISQVVHISRYRTFGKLLRTKLATGLNQHYLLIKIEISEVGGF